MHCSLKDNLILSLLIGRAGEFLTAYHLELFGHSPRIVGGEDFDIIAIDKKNLIRVQVKTRDQVEPKRKTYTYTCVKSGQRLSLKNADIFALVCLPLEKIIFKVAEDIRKTKTIRIPPEDFLLQTNLESWQMCLGRIKYNELE